MAKYRVIVQIDKILDEDPDEMEPVEIRNTSWYFTGPEETEDHTQILIENLHDMYEMWLETTDGTEVAE